VTTPPELFCRARHISAGARRSRILTQGHQAIDTRAPTTAMARIRSPFPTLSEDQKAEDARHDQRTGPVPCGCVVSDSERAGRPHGDKANYQPAIAVDDREKRRDQTGRPARSPTLAKRCCCHWHSVAVRLAARALAGSAGSPAEPAVRTTTISAGKQAGSVSSQPIMPFRHISLGRVFRLLLPRSGQRLLQQETATMAKGRAAQTPYQAQAKPVEALQRRSPPCRTGVHIKKAAISADAVAH